MHNEAPASVSYSLLSPAGFPLIFTVRGENHGDLLQEMEGIEVALGDMGYTPDSKKGYPKKEKILTGETCPKCSGNLVEATKKDGSKFEKCENNVWDFNLKKNVGTCDYVNWGESTTMPDGNMNSATQKQKDLIQSKWPHLWEEGMSKAQAGDVISSQMNK